MSFASQIRPPADARAAGADHTPLDIVFIDGFRGDTVIGIHHDELHDAQPVRIDLAIGVPRPRACDTDRIADTIDYGEVRMALREMLANHRYRLLEAFAEAIAGLLIQRFGAHWVRIAVAKPAKFDDVDGVGVIIERRRDDFRSAGNAAHDGEVLSVLGGGLVPGSKLR